MRTLLFACLPLFAACASAPAAPTRPPVSAGEEFFLAMGESVGVNGGDFTVEFSRVLEDSRCPMNARCVWEGNARIALEVREAARRQVIELNTSERFPTRGSLGENSKGISIRLHHLEPTPMAGVPTQDYVATLEVEAVK
jgi:hypothetical protein